MPQGQTTITVDEAEYWHAQSVEEVLKAQVTSKDGLSDQEAQSRLAKYGKNELTPPAKAGFLRKLFDQINNILIYILIVAAIVLGVIGEYIEVALICAVVAINVTIGLIQEGKAEKAADAIKGMLSSKATVIRNGEKQVIDAALVVPGDLVFITSGDRVPADLRMIEVTNCSVLEAMLTGESNPINKHTDPVEEKCALGDRKCLAFSATMVMSGQGKGVVVGTGDLAEIGKISTMVGQTDSMKTNLQVQLEIFGRWISAFVLIIGGITFIIAYEGVGVGTEDVGTAFKSAVSIAVAIIPEGLPAVVTISLALAMQLLAKSNAIIRQLPAVETLGSVSVICSDKTGTLTKNEMTVQAIQTADGQIDFEGVGYEPEGKLLKNGTPISSDEQKNLLEMFQGCILCNDSGLRKGEKQWEPTGYPTEVAMLTMGMKMGIPSLREFQDQKPRIAAVPFASEHKFMFCVHSHGSETFAHVKGAPDRILKQCKDQVTGNKMSSTGSFNKKYWEDEASRLSALGLRVLAVARAPYSKAQCSDNMDADVLLKASSPFLTMIGLVAILDPPRPEAIEGVAVAKGAGIVVKMITGDHPQTACAIAKMLGIIDEHETNPRVYTGPQLDEMSDDALDLIVLDCNVYARASPENKISIVKSLQRRGQICSMTGDGVNDAPALKAANIGVAMGITGTDVSKEAAKMVLADDNFATIVKAVREGRRVWDNLVKILMYNMPVNFAQGLSVFFSYVIPLDAKPPLTAIQVLYVNMVTSVTMGMMLAMEPAEDTVMTRPPRKSTKRLFGKQVMWHCIFVSAIIVICVIGNFQWALVTHPDSYFENAGRRAGPSERSPRIDEARGEAFNMLVFAEMAYALNCRFLKETSITTKLFTQNIWCWVAIGIATALQFFLTYTPSVNSFFYNGPIDGIAWARILGFSVAVFLIVEIEKAIGPKYLMPFVRPVLSAIGSIVPKSMKTARTLSEMQNIHFIATSASTTGLQHPHAATRQSALAKTKGFDHPVDRHMHNVHREHTPFHKQHRSPFPFASPHHSMFPHPPHFGGPPMPPFGSPPMPMPGMMPPMGYPPMMPPHFGGSPPPMMSPPMPMIPPMMGMASLGGLEQGGNLPRDPAFAMGFPMQSAPMFKPF